MRRSEGAQHPAGKDFSGFYLLCQGSQAKWFSKILLLFCLFALETVAGLDGSCGRAGLLQKCGPVQLGALIFCCWSPVPAFPGTGSKHKMSSAETVGLGKAKHCKTYAGLVHKAQCCLSSAPHQKRAPRLALQQDCIRTLLPLSCLGKVLPCGEHHTPQQGSLVLAQDRANTMLQLLQLCWFGAWAGSSGNGVNCPAGRGVTGAQSGRSILSVPGCFTS